MKKKIKAFVNKKVTAFCEKQLGDFYFKQKGFCTCCDKEVDFVAHKSWLRDNFRCSNCKSIPRERALMLIIEKEYPNWKNLSIHESSPDKRGHSKKLRSQNTAYLETQFFLNEKPGAIVNGVRSEDLENQTFEDNSFDLVITSDVMEHVYDPEKAFKEIHRTLKPGGAHIFSVPIINKHKKTQRWANKGANGEPEFLFEPEWHGNPINKKGSPVTMHWGFDIVDFIKEHTGAECWIEYINNLEYGIRAEYIEIIVSKKV